MPVLAMVLWPIMAIPMVTAFYARNTGRPFWPWFAIGCLLPIISFAILWFLPEQKKEIA